MAVASPVKKLKTIITILTCLWFQTAWEPETAFAETGDIVIQDTSGFTRNTTSVEDFGKVEFSLTDAAGTPAEGAQISLTNTLDGQVLQAVSANGLATFESVAPGVWTVASTSPSVTFTGVVITSTALAGTAVAGAAGIIPIVVGGGAAAAAVTGAAIAVSESDGNRSDDIPLSPFS